MCFPVLFSEEVLLAVAVGAPVDDLAGCGVKPVQVPMESFHGPDEAEEVHLVVFDWALVVTLFRFLPLYSRCARSQQIQSLSCWLLNSANLVNEKNCFSVRSLALDARGVLDEGVRDHGLLLVADLGVVVVFIEHVTCYVLVDKGVFDIFFYLKFNQRVVGSSLSNASFNFR